MRQSERFLGGLACALAITACSGFDPSSLVPASPEPDEAGAAGYSYDPGPSGGQATTPTRPTVGDGGSGAISSFGAGGSTNGSSEGGDDGLEQDSASGAGRASTPAKGGGSSGGTGGATRGTTEGGAASNVGAASGGAGAVDGAASGTAGDAGASGGEGGTPALLPRELFFSEYVEAGADKALEIFAVVMTNLEGCELAIYSNGSTTAHTLKLDGAVEGGAVYTLCSSKLAAKTHCDRSTNLAFDGNDAVALVCDGTTLDVIGQIGVDPNDPATTTDPSIADETLRRRCGVTAGDADGTDPFDPAVEWLTLPADTLDGLGDPTCG